MGHWVKVVCILQWSHVTLKPAHYLDVVVVQKTEKPVHSSFVCEINLKIDLWMLQRPFFNSMSYQMMHVLQWTFFWHGSKKVLRKVLAGHSWSLGKSGLHFFSIQLISWRYWTAQMEPSHAKTSTKMCGIVKNMVGWSLFMIGHTQSPLVLL